MWITSLCAMIIHVCLCGDTSAFQPPAWLSSYRHRSTYIPIKMPLSSISGPLLSSRSDDGKIDYDAEETLLKLHFKLNDDIDRGFAIKKLSRFCQSFPFAAVLPVQPLQYLPTPDGGVDVLFLRKKTEEKGSVDGGIRFFISEEFDGIDVLVKRNSEGQTVSKIFSEKLVVQSFIKRVTGEELDRSIPPPTDVVTLSSVFHQWME